MVEFIKAILFGVGAACNFADPEAVDDPEVADLEAAEPEAADPKVADPADNVEAADRVEAAEAAEAAEAPRATGVGGEIDVDEGEDSIDDNPLEWKGTKIEINGSVMLGVGLEPCSIARFTMIEKTEDDYYDDEEDEEYIDDDTDDDNDNLPELHDGIGSFE